MQEANVEYAGFWIRVGAALIDSVIVIAVIFPLLVWIYGWSYFGDIPACSPGRADLLISWVAPAVAVIAFWLYARRRPERWCSRCAWSMQRRGGTLSVGQSIGRYLGILRFDDSAVPRLDMGGV